MSIPTNNRELERLKKVAEKYFISLSNLAIILNKSKTTFYGYKNRERLGIKIIQEIERQLGINSEYIKHGDLPMMLHYDSIRVELSTQELKEIEKQKANPKNLKANASEIPHANASEIPHIDATVINKKEISTVEKFNIAGGELSLKLIIANAGSGFTYSDIADEKIDVLQAITEDKPRIHAAVVNGNSMENIGIINGDILIIEDRIKPVYGEIIICNLNGVNLIKKYEERNDEFLCHLTSANSHYEDIPVKHSDSFVIFGIATKVIHNL